MDVKENINSVEWTPEVVYKVYCNDDLNTLPLGILKDMQKYIGAIIDLEEFGIERLE